MSRKTRNTLILAKVQTTPGVDALPTGAANALLISEMSIDPLDAQNIDRALIRGYFGGSEELVGPASVKVTLSVELAGAGAAATAPAWGVLMLGCAMGEGLLSTPGRVEYTPVSDSLKALTIYYYDSGVLHVLLDAMGTCTLTAKQGERPMLKYEFIGLDGGIAEATATGTFTAWKKPVAMTKANVVDITLGSTYALGEITGGVIYPSTGLELMLGNALSFTPLLSNETVDIYDRVVTGSVELELTAAQEVAFMATVKANATQSIALTIGTATGNKIIIYGPEAQLLRPKKVDLNGKRLVGYDLRLVPTAAGTGNDELRLISV